MNLTKFNPHFNQPGFLHSTPLGKMVSTWTDRGLYRLDWNLGLDWNLDDLAESCECSADGPERQLDSLLAEYFRDGIADFESVQIDEDGWTDLSTQVYRLCRKIPAGKTSTYKRLAESVGRPGASRAIGGAMSRNRILIVIPCHRVIASNGKLQGFSAPGGLRTKQSLLDLEQSKGKSP
ncbi:Methylated-DNA--protein-cysteine methyltransferase [Rubripirellula obstinata]|uniref:methylated-DNA--[protein]-cysteine S-methyltransferase n=1 Tax=Rubripirellula obstinata TaxID=406547 RepID=A0A5B1CDU0_9BACT|nr:MGMT family protein [Rubripirellula obstinata]KAA1259288.1 Methylated-DNA--protein-cysteine methyltransferase [Rubripirellula obstinata]